MNRTRTAATLLLAGCLLAACSPSYDESVEQCTKAIKTRTTPNPVRPKPCEPLKEDDYAVLVASKAMDDLGWTDKDGNFDKDKFYRDALDGKP